jgi:carbon storage regulator
LRQTSSLPGHRRLRTCDNSASAWCLLRDCLLETQTSAEEIAMLVLTRKKDETIIIGTNITVTVLSLDRGRVRLGIEAPREVPVTRPELAAETDSVCAIAGSDL